jgi:hypothetical protein
VYYRYLAGLVPLGMLAMGVIFNELLTVNYRPVKWAAVAALLVVSGQVKSYIIEITTPYKGPVYGIVEFLKKNAAKEDIVAITYEDLPVKFYTGMRVIGSLTGAKDQADIENARWVIIRKYKTLGRPGEMRLLLLSLMEKKIYKEFKIDYPDTEYQDREDPYWHRQKPDPDEDRVIIYMKPVK